MDREWLHVYPYPSDPPHEVEGLTCWCGPTYEAPCSQCDQDGSDCWKCGGVGVVEVDLTGARESPVLVIIHEDTTW